MKLLNMIKIRTKLLILVAFMILAIAAVGMIGYSYNQKSNNALKGMYTENVLAIEKLSDARTQSRANFANILNLMVTEDAEGRQSILDDIKERNGKITDDFTEFEKSGLAGYEVQQYQAIKYNQDEWLKMSDQLVELITSEKITEAQELFKSSGEAIFEDLQTSIRDLVNYNIDDAETVYTQNTKNGQDASALLLTISVLVSIIAIVLGLLFMFSIITSISGIIKIIDKTSKLDLQHDDAHQVYKSYKDETGAIARAVGELRSALRNMVGNISAISNNLAASSEELAASTEESTKTINQVVNSINEIAIGNNAQAETISNVSENIISMASRIYDVDKATEINSENSKSSLEMIEEGQKAIDLTIRKIRENMEVSNAVEESIEELSNQMDKVVNIIDVIGAISEQTNLLSLNASIEAARAGEAGRGFAVVASEIGKLSKNTANSVNEITGIISDTVAKNKETAANIAKARELAVEQEKAIQITKESFKKIKVSVDDIAILTDEISDQIRAINDSAAEVTNQTQDMSAVSQESAASSEEISATNEEQLAAIEMIASATTELSIMATDLNNEISKFRL